MQGADGQAKGFDGADQAVQEERVKELSRRFIYQKSVEDFEACNRFLSRRAVLEINELCWQISDRQLAVGLAFSIYGGTREKEKTKTHEAD